jgi:sialic acid synthase SpsE
MIKNILKKKPYIIAEIGANHNGNFSLAKKTISYAKKAGCDAVKFQSWDESLNADFIYEKNKVFLKQMKKYKITFN